MRVRNDGKYVYVFDLPFTVEEAFRLARLIHGNAMECNDNMTKLEEEAWALAKLEEVSMHTSDELQGRVQEVYMWLRHHGGEGDRREAGEEDQAVRDGAQRDAPVT